MCIVPILVAALAITAPTLPPAQAAQVDDRAAIAIARPAKLVLDESLPKATASVMLAPVGAFYGFWNNGSRALLDYAIVPASSIIRCRPGARRVPAGPAAAAGEAFLAAVSDMTVAVVQRLVVGARVVSHLRCAGPFTGTFLGAKGAGQPVDFIARDILRVANGRITDKWHLEDNLAFLRQVGFEVGG